jgi:serine/threonine-protein phosphatase 2A regulatory subunit A
VRRLYLDKLINNLESVEDEDEVLTALSEELGKFVEYVGGPEHAHVLLSPLENLAAIEEPLVREKVRSRILHTRFS